MAKNWQLSIPEIISLLSTDATKGLDSKQVAERLDKFGLNQLQERKKAGPWALFLEQFKDFMIWVLIGAAVISGFLKEWVDALAIVTIVILNAILGFIQEYRAEKALQALKRLSSPNSKAIRDGKSIILPSSTLVPGDLIELESGDHVPADGRLVWISANFQTQEASLTGESNPVQKIIEVLDSPEIGIGDRLNMVFTGTAVVSGRARAVVMDTGMRTELGQIAGMIQSPERESTPLQKKLEQFGKWIVYLCFFLVALVFLFELLRGGKIVDVFLTAVSLAVAAIPEGLPAVVTIALALGVQRMVKRHALVRKLPSVETLGCATVICTDKTGTLTRNEMTVRMFYSGGRFFEVTGLGYEPKGGFLSFGKEFDPGSLPELTKTLYIAVICNSAKLIHDPAKGYFINGDPTEGSLLTAAAKAGITLEKIQEEYNFVQEIPFDSVRKMMSVVSRNRDERKTGLYCKGAPEVILGKCSRFLKDGKVMEMTPEMRKSFLQADAEMAGKAMRVLALAYRDLEGDVSSFSTDVLEKDLIFAGLAAMIDPPRQEVKQAIALCKQAGIKTVMITGDHKNTAVAIARELNFYHENSLSVSGEELGRMSENELAEKLPSIAVYARVSPEHKLRIVKAWRRAGQVVAMTGDGVNDAPAVKEADIGIAMGITGTDVTKEVSDMVVTDDNFASIVSAVEEGRGIYDNIKKFIHYLLSCNTGEVLVMFSASMFGLPVPLLPIQILWVNLVTDGLPALALGIDPLDHAVMSESPRSPHEPVISRNQIWVIVMQGAFIAACSLLAFCYTLFVEKSSVACARTAAFVVLACAQLFHSLNCRNSRKSIFKIGFFSNPHLILAIFISFLLQMAVVYIPFLNSIFKTEPLTMHDWIFVILVSSFPLWAMEIFKFVMNKIRKNNA